MGITMVKLICYNIEHCEGIRGHLYEYFMLWKKLFPPKGLDNKIIRELHRMEPDILALVEIDDGSVRAMKDEGKYFKSKMKMKSLVEEVKYPWHGLLSFFHHLPILRHQANALLAKYPFEKIVYHELHEGTKRVVIEATVRCPKPVTLLLAHLALGKRTRAKQFDDLIEFVKKCKNPVILLGDFNTYNGLREIQQLLQKTHLKDSIPLPEESKVFTHPTWHPFRRLDYILVSKEIKVKSYDVLPFEFSDHLPLMIDFTVQETKK